MNARLAARIVLVLVLPIGAVARGAAPDPTAQGVMKLAGVSGGVCVLLDCGDGRLLADLAGTRRFLVHGLCADPSEAAAARKRLAGAGLAGVASVEAMPLKGLPYADNMVNLMLVADLPACIDGGLALEEIVRVLAPKGVACLGVAEARRKEIETLLTKAGATEFRFQQAGLGWLVITKPRPAGMDDWTHAAHGPDGNPVSGDRILTAPNQLQWIAGPSWRVRRSDAGPAAAHPGGVLSADGRNYYIQGRNLIARCSFNGVLLWVKPLPGRVRMSQIVAAGERVYLCREDKAVALDAASGEESVSYAAPACSQLLLDGGTLFAVSSGRVIAFDAATGREKWKAALRAGRIVAEGGRLFLSPGGGQLACFSRDDGKEIWRKDVRPDAGDGAGLRFACNGALVMAAGGAKETRFTVLSAVDGSKAWAFASNKKDALAFYAGELLWLETDTDTAAEGQPGKKTGSEVISRWFGHDARTGELRRTLTGPVNVVYRCHTLYATDRFMIGNRPLYFMDWTSGEVAAFEGTRAECGSAYGLGQGLFFGLYTNAERCMCMATVIAGVTAFAADGKTCNGQVSDAEHPLVKGTAEPPAEAGEGGADDWPMYRRDHRRSAATDARLPDELAVAWRQKVLPPAGEEGVVQYDWRVNRPIGDVITAPTVAGGKVFVGLTHAHRVVALDAADGRIAWTFQTPARVDAPPTVYQGLCLVGCHDGWVYCLRADSGELVWRFRAAPAERRMVAYGQIESAWPVVGGVLLVKGVACVIAGRTTEADGGLYVHALDPKTGKLLWSGRRGRMSNAPFGGYTPRRGTTYIGPADVLCCDGERISISGSHRGRFRYDTGELVNSWDRAIPFGWMPARYRLDQYGTRTGGVTFLGRAMYVVDRQTGAIGSPGKGGWRAEVPRPKTVESLVAVGDDARLAGPGPRPIARVPRVGKPPKIDGTIDDLYVKTAPPLRFAMLDGAKTKPKEATTAYLVSDRENLYIAVRCEKADPDKVVCAKTRRDDGVWEDECVELFIDPANTRQRKYCHIIVNPAGVTQDARAGDASWDPALTVKCGKEPGKAWIAEIKLPFSELGAAGEQAGRVWSLNLNRSARAAGNPSQCEDTAWSPTGRDSSHVPQMFGYAWLDALPGGDDQAAFKAWRDKIGPPADTEKDDTKAARKDVILASVSYNSAYAPGGEVWALSAEDGSKLAACKLPAAPAYDGLAVAGGRVFVTLQDGSVACLGGSK